MIHAGYTTRTGKNRFSLNAATTSIGSPSDASSCGNGRSNEPAD